MARGKKKRRRRPAERVAKKHPGNARPTAKVTDATSDPSWPRLLIRGAVAFVVFAALPWLITAELGVAFWAFGLLGIAIYAAGHFLFDRSLGKLPRNGQAAISRLRAFKPETQAGKVLELVVIAALALGLALAIQAWLVKPFRIPSASMEPTMDIGQRILVSRLIYDFNDPTVGDIVVFHPPVGADDHGTTCGAAHGLDRPCPEPIPRQSSENFAKRIVALPGDRVRIIHGQAIVNGRSDPAANDAAENSLTFAECGRPLPPPGWKDARPDGRCNLPKPITVPADHYFMMGDRRGGSLDSRYWGPVPRDWIIGKALATYWPPDHLGPGF